MKGEKRWIKKLARFANGTCTEEQANSNVISVAISIKITPQVTST